MQKTTIKDSFENLINAKFIEMLITSVKYKHLVNGTLFIYLFI